MTHTAFCPWTWPGQGASRTLQPLVPPQGPNKRPYIFLDPWRVPLFAREPDQGGVLPVLSSLTLHQGPNF